MGSLVNDLSQVVGAIIHFHIIVVNLSEDFLGCWVLAEVAYHPKIIDDMHTLHSGNDENVRVIFLPRSMRMCEPMVQTTERQHLHLHFGNSG